MNMNLLLIDSRVKDQETVINSLLSYTKYIIVDYLNDTSQTIYNKINQLNITNFVNVGLFQENFNMPTYQFVRSFQNSVLDNIQNKIHH